MVPPPDGYVALANLEVDTVRAQPHGFVMEAWDDDRTDYLMEMHLDMPIDRRTQAILAEMLSQSEWKIYRRARKPLRPRSARGIRSP